MNKAQKRAWLNFAISLAGILIGAAVFTFIKVNEIRISSTEIRSLIWQREWEAASHMLGRDVVLVI